MNKQGNKLKPLGGIEWTHIFGPLTGHTANPVRGCTHACEWEMPDGSKAECYAKGIGDRFYEGGFADMLTDSRPAVRGKQGSTESRPTIPPTKGDASHAGYFPVRPGGTMK